MYQGEQISYSKIFNSRKFNPIIQKHKAETKTQLQNFSFLFLLFPLQFLCKQTDPNAGGKKTNTIYQIIKQLPLTKTARASLA